MFAFVKTPTTLAFLGCALMFPVMGYANVWIDETFDDGVAFNAEDLDVFDATPPTNPMLTLASQQGAVSSTRAFNGAFSYRLQPGESLAVGPGSFENAANGPYQYLQLAASVGAIPAAPGSVGTLRYNFDFGQTGGTTHSFFIDFRSTGSEIEVVAGEDLNDNVSRTIGMLPDASTWIHLTLQLQKNGTPQTDSRTGQSLPQGMRFYSSQNEAFAIIVNQADQEIASTGWSIVSNGADLFIDDLYWEGGLTANGNEGDGNLRSFPIPAEIPNQCALPEDFPARLVSIGEDPIFKDMLRPRDSGWIGSDIAHSIVLSEEKTLWLFGDTLVGTVTNGQRSLDAFINNSIGIQDRTQPPPDNIEFFWDTSGGGHASFFPHQAGTPGDWYWPTMGVMLEGELFLFSFSVEAGGGLGFSIPGMTLIRVPNPLDPPDQWIQNAFDLGLGGNNLGFHTALTVIEPHLYMFGYHDPGGDTSQRRTVLARVLIDDLLAGGLSETFEFWVDNGSGPEWDPDPVNLVTLFTPGVTESAIQYDPALGLYFFITYDVFTPETFITAAPHPTGPWTEPACFYLVPQHGEVSFPIISYAARPHPELSTAVGEIVFTHATNAFGNFGDLFTQEGLEIYFPRFVRMKLDPIIEVLSEAHGWERYE